MDKTKFLARVDDDLIAHDAFRSVVAAKTNQYTELRHRLDGRLNRVVEDKEKQDQEEKVKREAGALSDAEADTDRPDAQTSGSTTQ